MNQCKNNAEWWLTEGAGPDEYTVSCTEHLGVMVSDNTSNIAPATTLTEPCCYSGHWEKWQVDALRAVKQEVLQAPETASRAFDKILGP